MTVLFGHPTGNPNSHQAALAYHEAGWLEAFCVPWMPSPGLLRGLQQFGLADFSLRLSGRGFAPLQDAVIIQDRLGEAIRILLKAMGRTDEGLAYCANDWVMRTMRRECARPTVSAVHSYEDCSLEAFEAAKRLGKACVYDLPIGFHPAWLDLQKDLRSRYADWLPDEGLPEDKYVRPEQKRREVNLADCVLAPSEFVCRTLKEHLPKVEVHLARYGVDTGEWPAVERRERDGPLRFLFVGQCSLRKGVPLLLEAWKKAAIQDATLDLVGGWHLNTRKLRDLPARVGWTPHVPKWRLREYYATADVFVLPTYFEGRALVVGEALASGLPVITTSSSGCDDLLQPSYARILQAGSEDELISSLQWFSTHRSCLVEVAKAARLAAVECSWRDYRHQVRGVVEPLL